MLGEAPVTTVLGQRGTGKTTWVKKELCSLPRWILWDTLGEYSGAPIVKARADLFQEVEDWGDGGVHRVIFNCLEDNEMEALSFTCRLCEALGNVTLIIEEVDSYATPTIIPPDLRRLLKIGRHYHVGMIFISRRPAEINRLITSQTRRFVCFRLIEPNDLRYLSSVIGSLSEDVKALADLHFVDWQHGSIEKGQVNIPGIPQK